MHRTTNLFREVQKFLIPLGAKQEFKDLMNILFNWQIILDQDISDYTSPYSFKNTTKGRVLEVHICNNVIGTELYYRKKEMISKVNAILAKEKICDILFLVKKDGANLYGSTKPKLRSRINKECEYTKAINTEELKASLDRLYSAISERND